MSVPTFKVGVPLASSSTATVHIMYAQAELHIFKVVKLKTCFCRAGHIIYYLYDIMPLSMHSFGNDNLPCCCSQMLMSALITMLDVVTTVQTLMDLITVVVLMDLNYHQTIIHVKVTNSKQYYVLIIITLCTHV